MSKNRIILNIQQLIGRVEIVVSPDEENIDLRSLREKLKTRLAECCLEALDNFRRVRCNLLHGAFDLDPVADYTNIQSLIDTSIEERASQQGGFGKSADKRKEFLIYP